MANGDGPELLSIGSVADATGLSVSAIRYYDERGLIAAATRVGGKRRFDPRTVGTLNFVRRAQEAGFSLDEITAILADDEGRWRGLVDDKIVELIERRHRLDEMLGLLDEIRTCGCSVVAECPRMSS